MIAIEQLPDIARKLAPELKTAGLRFLKHQESWPMPQGASAYALRGRHLAIEQHLKSIGKWNNVVGSTIVFAEPPTLPVLLHEMSHLLPAVPAIAVVGVEPTTAQVAANERQIELMAQSCRSSAVPWQGHGWKWIRNAIHIRWRAENQLGLAASLGEMNVAGERYQLSMPAVYEAELGSEPRYLSRKSFAEIERVDPPPSFCRLFARDVEEFFLHRFLDEIEDLPNKEKSPCQP